MISKNIFKYYYLIYTFHIYICIYIRIQDQTDTIYKCIQTVNRLEEEGIDIMNDLEINKEKMKSSQEKVLYDIYMNYVYIYI